MERYRLEKPLPSCRVSKELLTRLEAQLLFKLPKLLKRNMASMMEVLDLKSRESLVRYAILLEDARGVRELSGIAELREERLPPTLARVELLFRLGRPEILSVRFRFAKGERPILEISTLSRQVKPLCSGIAEGLFGVVEAWSNRHRLAHNRGMQLLIALIPAAAVIGYGSLRGVDPFALYASQGWLVLLAGGLSLSLPRLFPYVTFHTGRRLDVRRLLLAGLVGLNLFAISGYIRLLLMELRPL